MAPQEGEVAMRSSAAVVGPGGRSRRQWRRAGGSVATIAVAMAALVIVGGVWAGDEFLSAANMTTVSSAAAVPLLVGTVASIGLLAGVVDLSIGSVTALGGMVFAVLSGGGMAALPAAVIAVASGAAAGTINAVAIVGFGAESLVATLGALTAVRGLVLAIAGGKSHVAFVPGLYDFTARAWGDVNALFVLVLVLVVAVTVFVMRTRPGRHLRAVGGDERAAQRMGISVPRIRAAALVLSGAVAALGGVLYVGQLGSAPVTLGTGLEFDVYAAVMIGGYSILRGGVGNPVGACVGILVIAGLGNLLDVQSVNSYWQDVIVGAALVAAVYADRLRGGDVFE
jgi:ribose/xylose/arabinose/galactoside ABC-type transport system permease subunit